MRVIENYENIHAFSGEFARPGNGGYIKHPRGLSTMPKVNKVNKTLLTVVFVSFIIKTSVNKGNKTMKVT